MPHTSTAWLILSCDPDSQDLALEELGRVAPSRVAAALGEGVLLLESESTFAAIAARWRDEPPIFVRHVAPVQRAVNLVGTEEDLQALPAALGGLLAGLDPARPFSVQARLFAELPYKPFALNEAIAAAVAARAGAPPLDVRRPQQIISIACAQMPDPATTTRLFRAFPTEKGAPRGRYGLFALAGLSTPEENLSDWAGGMRRFAREEGRVSRSEFKLLEALEVFGVTLPPRGVALDLGASPGGWTRVLRTRDQYVTAVDPGDLDERVLADPGVRHKRMTAEQYLREDPDQFDVIVNDMRMDARDSARMMAAYAPRLYRHGVAVMTLKLPEANRAPVLDHAFNLLRAAYEIAGARQLFHNRSEITVYLKPKS
jgi:23S rRNA (cytidine2498-2'-O)-methyltransferase